MAGHKKIPVLVRIPELAGKAFRDAVKELAARGLVMEPDSAMETLGVVEGVTEPEKMDSLREVEGVAEVRPQKKISLP